ncbi:MAG TPA: site-specific integrase [Candidatus Acidoferrum sp.]|nr:site-specific integrase [Candidatus Acidoferrum sp.]
MPLDARGTLRIDAEQAKRVIFGGKKMARRRFQLGSLFQRGKRPKVWVARWWEEIINPDGSIGRRRRAEVLGTVAELCSRSQAMEALTKRLNPINSGIHRPQSTRTFSSFVREDWLPVVLPTVKYATQKNYRYFLDVHLLPAFGERPLCDIKREPIQSFLAAKLSSGLAWKTVKEIRGVLGRILGTAERWEYINDNQARKTRLPRRPLKLAPKPVLAPEQVRQLAGELAEPAKSIALLLVLTGLRVGELLALRWKNIDLAGRTLRVTATVYDGHFDTPKTQRSNRLIPIGAATSDVLRTLCHAAAKSEDLVFSTRERQPLSRHNLLRRQLRPACKKLGLHGITWHSLRHSHATLLDAVGAPLGTVQALLGHSTSEITREVYVHAIPEDQRRAVAGVESLVLGFKRTQL